MKLFTSIKEVFITWLAKYSNIKLSWVVATSVLFSSYVMSTESPLIPINSDMTSATHQELVEFLNSNELLLQRTTGKKKSDWNFINALVKSNSPYLLKHASNPISWQGWSDEVIKQARSKNKLIFLSIGFSTCFWCQQMEKESFRNTELAAFINSHFIPVKVDRELHPAVDNYYTFAQELINGTSGWPVTAIITEHGHPIIIDSYLKREELAITLKNVATMWSSSPERLVSNAKKLADLIDRGLSNNIQPGDSPKINWGEINSRILQELDSTNGGLKGQQKFPEGSLLLYMIDSAKRQDSASFKKLLILHLNNMADKGLYDHVHGGFHRYSSDTAWNVPHYEKMLYTQAMMVMVYSKAYHLLGDERYKQIVVDVLEFVMSQMGTKDDGFYSAIDAVYRGMEGGYSLINEQDLASITPEAASLANMTVFRRPKDHKYKVHIARPYNKQAYELVNRLSQSKDDSFLNIDKKRITSWNALIVWALAEGAHLIGQPTLIADAEELANYIWNEHLKEGQLFRVRFKDKLEQSATLEDYAFLARAYISLYDLSSNKIWLNRAEVLVEMAISDLYLPETGFVLATSKNLPSRITSSVDSETFSPHAVLFDAITMLSSRLDVNKFKAQITALENRLSSSLDKSVFGSFFGAIVLRGQRQGRIESIQYFARGNGKLHVIKQVNCTHALTVKLREGWYVNSDSPISSELYPTNVSFLEGNNQNITYPGTQKLFFGQDNIEMSVFPNHFTIILDVMDGIVRFDTQACSKLDNLCLLPESKQIYLPNCKAP